jgi:hypothetical protein
MLLAGIASVILLACSGLFVDKYVKTMDSEPESYFKDDVPELGIQPQNVLILLYS